MADYTKTYMDPRIIGYDLLWIIDLGAVLILKLVVSIFISSRFLEALRVEWQNSTPERRSENINLSKYFSSSGDRTHSQSVLQAHFVPLRRD